jgi:toxin ParE1/3/4
VARFRISRRAEADLYNIGLYTLRIWGEAQAEHYLRELEDCCQQLADSPGRGRACDEIRPGLRRMEQGRHVIFYREDAGGGILISRILHQRMLPEKQTIDDDETKPD